MRNNQYAENIFTEISYKDSKPSPFDLTEYYWELNLLTGRLTIAEESVSFLGYSLEQLKGGKAFWENNIHPDDKEVFVRNLHSAISRMKNTWSGSYRFQKADGTYACLYHKCFIVYDEAHNAYCITGSVGEVYPERAMPPSNSLGFFKKLVDHAPLSIVSFTTAGMITYANSTFLQLTGRDENTYKNDCWLLSIHPEDKQKVLKAFQALKLTSHTVAVTFRIKCFDGTWRWMTIHVIAEQQVYCQEPVFTGFLVDITELKTVQNLLKEDTSRVHAILEHLPQMAWTSSSDGEINYFTRRWYEYTGQTEEEAINMGCRNALHPQDDAYAFPIYKKAIENQIPYEIEKRIKRASDGQYRWHMVRSRPIRNDDGSIYMWVGTCTDIHDQKMIAQELEEGVRQRTLALEQANAELESSNAELEQFAYIASHDLQEPLRKIQFFSDLIQSDISKQQYENLQTLANRIQTASSRMSQLLRDMLYYSRIGHKEQQIFIKVNLQSIVDQILVDLEATIRQKNAIIHITGLPEIEAASLLMHQLFLNLISNSLKFVNDDRTPVITISCEHLTDAEKEAHGLRESQQYCKIILQDNGIGFDPQFTERIFILFQRLNTAEKYPGTGIGLAICKKIIDRHQGLIFAEGIKDQGAKFTMILPYQQGQVS